MSLLSLPDKLLNEIIALAIQTPAQDPCRSPGCPGVEVSPPQPCTPPAATALAQTCHVFRSHALPLMYASLTVNIAHTRTLHALLIAWPHIASCVRTLTLFITDSPTSRLLLGIIRRCINLDDLELDGSHASGEFIGSLLPHASQHPIRSLTLRTFEWCEIWVYIAFAPPSVGTLRLEDPVRKMAWFIAGTGHVPIPHLPNVHTFICHTEVFDRIWGRTAGTLLAEFLPKVRTLDIHLTKITAQFLDGYVALGTQLTELTVHFLSEQSEFCETVSKLAPTLRKFVVHGGCVCEKLFAASWLCIEFMDVACQGGCRDVSPSEAREAVLRMVAARPTAEVTVVVDGGRRLVVSDRAGASVAALEEFLVLEGPCEDA